MKKKNEQLIKLIYFLFGVIILLVILMIIFKLKKDSVVKYNEKFYITETEVEKYLGYVPFVTDSNTLFVEDAYSGKKKSINNIRLDNIFVKVFDNTASIDQVEGSTKCIDENEFLNNLRKMYNIDVKVNNFIYNNGEVKRVSESYCSYVTGSNDGKIKVNKITSYKVKSSSLTIYERAAFIYKEGTEYKIYKDTNKENSINKSFTEVSDAVDYINNNIDNFNIFVHTFDGVDGIYYYSSTSIK